MTHTSFCILAAFVFGMTLASTTALAKERSEVNPHETWDLTDLYKSVDAFKAAKTAFAEKMGAIANFKGRLAESASVFKQALDTYYDLEGELRRMESYASKLTDQDTRDSAAKALDGEVSQLRTKYGAMTAFIEPEIVAMGKPTFESFLATEPGLKIYERVVEETFRRQAHILSPDQEKILAAAGDIAFSGMSIYQLFENADMPRQEVTLADGSTVKLSDANYTKYRRTTVKADRDLVAKTFFDQFQGFSRTMGETLLSQLKSHKFYSDMRGYPTTLAAALDRDEIDESIYHNIIEAAHRNFPTFQRYLKLKARALGVERVNYQDLYVPFTEKGMDDIPYAKAEEMMLEALKPMGKDYLKTVKKALDERWIDVYPTEGKRSGAYSSGWAYDVHPYLLMNYTGEFSEVLTLAHEMGHAMHSYYSNTNQPLPTSDYSIFVAEVASTFNENLLNDFMLKTVKNDDERFYLLGQFLDGTIKGTFFRQIQFAEFELLAHQMVENGQAPTGEDFNKLYLDLVRKYYGHDEGICNVPDFYAVEWAYIPHFYYNYYVFQYSTSVAAASAVGERVLAGEPGALDRYYSMLKAGSTKSPVQLLRDAGVDMTKPEAYQALMDRANRYMDEMEKILDAKGK